MILHAKQEDNYILAQIHQQTITQGFLSQLGHGFLSSLYSFLIKKELILILKKDQEIKGFVSCTLCSNGIMKRFFFSSPEGIFKLSIALLKKPKLIIPLLETYKAPDQSKSSKEENISIPETELLSISVAPSVQYGGIGSKLLSALEKELKARNILRYKVIAGEKLVGANKFYKKHGFTLAKKISIHGDAISNVYIKELR